MGGIKEVLDGASMEIDHEGDPDYGDATDENDVDGDGGAGTGDEKVVSDKGKAGKATDTEEDEADDTAEEEETDAEDDASARKGSGDGDGDDAKASKAGEKDLSKVKVPYHRMRAAIEARRQAEQEAEELRRQLKALEGSKGQPDPIKERADQLDALYEEVEQLRADGKAKDAAKIQRQIDTIKDEISEIKADKIATQKSYQAATRAAYEAFVEEVEMKIPMLNPDNESVFDEGLYDEVRSLTQDFIESKRYNPKAALQKALSLLIDEDVLTGKPSKKAEEVKLDVATQRKAAAVKKAVETSKKSGAALGNVGKDSKSLGIDIKSMSQEDFEKLPETTQARLRGDLL